VDEEGQEKVKPATRVKMVPKLQPATRQVMDPVLDDEGNPVLGDGVDEEGNPLLDAVLDEEGSPVMEAVLDEDDLPVLVPRLDEDGQPVVGEDGQPAVVAQQRPVMIPRQVPQMKPRLRQVMVPKLIPRLQVKMRPVFKPVIDDDLSRKINEELERKKQRKAVKEVTTEDLIAYLQPRRNKVVYHALWYLAFNLEDHQATKVILYDALKDVTSKSPIDPIKEHMFYFGLGHILKLKLYERTLVTFKNGVLKLNVNVGNLKKILQTVGEPISDRPIITTQQKQQMFADFLSDDFLDI
jgi:hypothetical protein